MANVVNIFGKVSDALRNAMDRDGKNFRISDISEVQSDAARDILRNALVLIVRDLMVRMVEAPLEQEDQIFFESLKAAVDTKGSLSKDGMFYYDEDDRELIVNFPIERADDLKEKIDVMYDNFCAISNEREIRVDLPGHGNPVCYVFFNQDTSGLLGSRMMTSITCTTLISLMKAHGFEDVVAANLETEPNVVMIKKTSVLAALKVEKLDLPRSGDGPASEGLSP